MVNTDGCLENSWIDPFMATIAWSIKTREKSKLSPIKGKRQVLCMWLQFILQAFLQYDYYCSLSRKLEQKIWFGFIEVHTLSYYRRGE